MRQHPLFAPFAFLLCAAALAACHKASPLQGTPPAINADVVLKRAANCDSLLQQIQTQAVLQMRTQLDAEKSQSYCCGGGVPVTAGGGANGGASDSPPPASYSTTNTQVAGVDEADFMKNDGTRIFTLSGQMLYAAKSWPPQDLAVTGKLAVEGWPTEMFLVDNQVVIFSSIYGGGPIYEAAGVARPAEAIACGIDGAGCFYGSSTTKITVVDVSDLTAPRVTSQLYLPGSSNGARRVDSSIRLVLSDNVQWPSGLQWWPPYNSSTSSDHDAWVAAIDALEDANEKLIRAAPITTWFPDGKRTLADGSTIDVGYQCSDFYLSSGSEELGLTTVATLDLNHLENGVSRASIVGQAGVIYATAAHLYLASEHWWWWPMFGQHDWTYIHAFDISDPARTAYIGSGGVEGHINDQFSLDESDGYLRVATSTAVYSNATGAVDGYVVGSRLSILGQQPAKDGSGGLRLGLVGQIESLEDNERITAMRFTGDTGYAVTFRAVDPLVTLDLSDPANPKKIAELTIPGFSTYLQPIDSKHLLAIGEDLPVDASGIPDYSKRNLQLSLYDVSDLAKPKRTAVQLVGTAWASSEAEWDHHAFNWYQPDPSKPGMLAIPFSDWLNTYNYDSDWWDAFISDVRVFSADPAGTITPIGSLGMEDIYISVGDGSWTYWYRPWVRRSVLSTDQAGNSYVYAISDAGLRVAALGSLHTTIATALFPGSSQ